MTRRSAVTLCLCLGVIGVSGCDQPQNINPPPITPTSPVAPPLQLPNATSETADRPLPDGFTQTDSGLRYKILTEGAGTKPTADNSVVANYRGWLDDGKEFDSGKAIEFPLRGVIPGWTEGLQLIGEGGKLELEIPPGLAYGPGGQGPIPPNSWLHFEVELVKVK